MIHDIQNENYLLQGNELLVDIVSAQHINSPKYLIGAFQAEAKISTPNKNNNIAIFENVNVRNYFCEIDGYRYPKDAVLTNFPENIYPDQYSDLKSFYKEYIWEESLNPFISYPEMKNEYPIHLLDLRFQVDHVTPKKIKLFEEFNTDPLNVNARIFVILVKHRQFELMSDGNKFIEVKVIKMKRINFIDFMKKFNSKTDTLNESDLQRVYNYNI